MRKNRFIHVDFTSKGHIFLNHHSQVIVLSEDIMILDFYHVVAPVTTPAGAKYNVS